jgi:hypothetical protein
MDIPPGKVRLSEFDIMIERWNKLLPAKRNARTRECLRDGHIWARVVCEGKVAYKICPNCMTYDNGFNRKRKAHVITRSPQNAK